MMKTLRFVMVLFYRYYSSGRPSSIPYFSTLSAVVLLIYMHIFQVLIILDKVDWLPMSSSDSNLAKKGKMALVLLPLYLILWFLVREKDIKNAEYDEDKLRKGGRLLIGYVILSMVVLFGSMFVFVKPK